jgi:hypothetical protein
LKLQGCNESSEPKRTGSDGDEWQSVFDYFDVNIHQQGPNKEENSGRNEQLSIFERKQNRNMNELIWMEDKLNN